MNVVFDTNGNDKQKEVCRKWNDDTITDIVYGGSKGSGKSYLGCSLIFANALIYPNTHYFIARKKLNDLRKFTIPSIMEVFEHWQVSNKYYNYNGADNVFTLYNGSKVFLLDCKYLPSDPLYQRFGSMQMTRGWIEEAGEFEQEAKNNLMASIGRWKNNTYNLTPKLLQTCNPSKNYLYREYYLKNKNNTIEGWKSFIQALPQDNKMLPDGYLENLNRTLSYNEKQRLLYGNWEYDDNPNTLISYDDIMNVFTNSHVTEGKDRYITADIARLGSDKAVIGVWFGFVLVDLVEFKQSTITQLQTAILTLKEKYKIPNSNIVADEDGVGGGVVDNCKIKGFVNNSKAMNGENYQNLKTQCYYKLAQMINDNQMYITAELSSKQKDDIVKDLEMIQSYQADKEGKMRILPKEEIKQQLGRSPDYSDMLAMRMYFVYNSPLKVRKSLFV